MANIPADLLARAIADLKEAEAASTAANARAEAAQADAAAKKEHLKEMRAVVEWVRARSEAQPPAEPAASPQDATATRFGRPIPEISNTDLSLQGLEKLGRTASTREISDQVKRDGHDLSPAQVRGALKYLAKKPNSPVETTPGSGLWRLRGDPGQVAPFQPRAVTMFPAGNGAVREAMG